MDASSHGDDSGREWAASVDSKMVESCGTQAESADQAVVVEEDDGSFGYLWFLSVLRWLLSVLKVFPVS